MRHETIGVILSLSKEEHVRPSLSRPGRLSIIGMHSSKPRFDKLSDTWSPFDKLRVTRG